MNGSLLNYFSKKVNVKKHDCDEGTDKEFGDSPSVKKLPVPVANDDVVIVISSDDENGRKFVKVENVLNKRYKRRQLQCLKDKNEVCVSSKLTKLLPTKQPDKKRKRSPDVSKNSDVAVMPTPCQTEKKNKSGNEGNLPKSMKPKHVLASPNNDEKNDQNKNEEVNLDSHIPYHLNNFKLVIDTVMNNLDDAKLFQGEDEIIINKFMNLQSSAQNLYVRLFHRKPTWLQLHKISYKDIVEEIPSVLEILVAANFVHCSAYASECPFTLQQVLSLLPAPEMKRLAKSLHLQTTGNKNKINMSILKLCKEQKSVMSVASGSIEDMVMKRALELLGPCYKIAATPKQAFNRLLLVFDVTKGTEDDSEYSLVGSSQPPYYGRHAQLNTILMTGMGRVVYPTYTINRCTPIFENREELLEYETAYHLLSEVMAACEMSDWKLALEIFEQAKQTNGLLSTGSKLRTTKLPLFLRSFTASAIYTRMQSLQVEVYQRLKDYAAASNILKSLLDQNVHGVTRRGYWFERLALNLDQHLRNPQEALNVIKRALEDPYVRVGHVIALVERAEKINLAKKIKEFDYEAFPKLLFSKAKEVTIVGRLLPKRMQTGKARFIRQNETTADDSDVMLCSVEQLALAHYKDEGYEQGLHGEGGTFTCFLCLLMWDILFVSGIDDVFRTSYQSCPLDYNTDEFYQNRKSAIDKRLSEIAEWQTDCFSVLQMITDTWNTHANVSCVGMNWELFSSLEDALVLARCIGGKLMSGILEIVAKDPRHTRSGLPDLVVWNAHSLQYKFVEVKGPGDRLSNNQKMWMHRLVSLGANVEVCHVTAAASRKLLC